MLTAYIDETISPRNPGKRGAGIYYVAALLVDSQQDSFIASRLATLKSHAIRQYGLPTDIEFHGTDMFQWRHDWKRMRGMYRESIGLYRQALEVLRDSEAHLIMRGVEIEGLQERYGQFAYPPHQVALQYCLERVNTFAEIKREDVKIVADRVNNQEEHERRIRAYQSRGHGGGGTSIPILRVSFSRLSGLIRVAAMDCKWWTWLHLLQIVLLRRCDHRPVRQTRR